MKTFESRRHYTERHTLDIYLIDTPDLRAEDITGSETRGPCHLRTKILYVSPQKSSYCSHRADVQTLRMLLRNLRQGFQTFHRYFPEIWNMNEIFINLCPSILLTDTEWQWFTCHDRDDIDMDFRKSTHTSLCSQAVQSTAAPSV